MVPPHTIELAYNAETEQHGAGVDSAAHRPRPPGPKQSAAVPAAVTVENAAPRLHAANGEIGAPSFSLTAQGRSGPQRTSRS
ncbi:hypothetical protein NDU88_004854 [Pleurodeles waltl]|uniref:Uncharacterized protein n=1 Tax=Pleurodeles waltl TaxID=8319 RepID=A0AAV7SK35_PLEWA|nr:hypothetical protein NDU88_004854 [Pleurodeles waltl]